MSHCARIFAVLIAATTASGHLEAQHCLGFVGGPVSAGSARGSAWTGEYRYARRTGVALASRYGKFVGAVGAEHIYDQELAATIRDFGVSVVADIAADTTEGLWICPALQVNLVLGPEQFTMWSESRLAAELSTGLGIALPVRVSDRLQVLPQVSGRLVSVMERWRREDQEATRSGRRFEIGTGVHLILDGNLALTMLAQFPSAGSQDRSFPFWRRRGEFAWQLALSYESCIRCR